MYMILNGKGSSSDCGPHCYCPVPFLLQKVSPIYILIKHICSYFKSSFFVCVLLLLCIRDELWGDCRF